MRVHTQMKIMIYLLLSGIINIRMAHLTRTRTTIAKPVDDAFRCHC